MANLLLEYIAISTFQTPKLVSIKHENTMHYAQCPNHYAQCTMSKKPPDENERIKKAEEKIW